MITCIREIRKAKGLTLDDVAKRCDPPTTAQTIGRLETGTRTVSVGWLNRIAKALGVQSADLVRMPDQESIPVAALLNHNGAHAPAKPATAIPPLASPGLIAVRVTAGVGDYRSGDEIWCERLMPAAFSGSLNRDVLRSEEHTSELQSLMRISYAVFCLNRDLHGMHTSSPTRRSSNLVLFRMPDQ